MIETLRQFTGGTRLFDATSALLAKLNIEFDRETAEPVDVADLYDGPMPQYLTDALQSIKDTYFIGIVNDQSLAGAKSADSLDDVAETKRHGGKYDGMFVFACDAKPYANLTRTAASALTRAFNRIACANPVILIIRQGNLLSLATCERMEYSQEWRQGTGEKLGKVNILRNINCEDPHRGHVDILNSLGDKAYPTFEEIYKHWMEVFSSELLTKKFYNELSDWYAWAVQVAKFPNDLSTNEDDDKFNHEACIRLITRLIFVWFLKQKHLIPEEFFDEQYIRENFIENFNPHDKENLLYNSNKSLYYRLILQNLFFAMLNCPIVAEGKTTPNNRRFIRESFQGKNPDYGINNLMRYKKEFMDGGSDKFLKFANSCVPFLNGGLFDCLDNKNKRIFYDGFSEETRSLEQLYLPDYLFFGEEAGKGIDLSQWYDDKKKKNVSARGIIDILKRYSFTIEENTPFDQEVSLDPELLGKVFENLLAAFNPETKQSARKQTGSFYTPREIVQYMVDESLVAHLKRICGDEHEADYRALVSYATSDIELPLTERKAIMNALYNCRVLDPACGSGAFPMGVLQQMVHVLKRIDPSNELWNELMIDIALADAKKELLKAADNESEKAKAEANRKARLDDIEEAFNSSINDPDYARKLYLIEHCIYGVDIQPIATQISKLRFFISLVVDQKPTLDPKTNFGIRPLPNLESKFVTANTLIPLDREKNVFTASDDIREYEETLHEINHRIFLAKRNKDKEELRELMKVTRTHMAQALENGGYISTKGFDQLVEWNMFDQNASAPFFDPEWMFGIKEGFDVVIGNPPYVQIKKLPQKEEYRQVGYSVYDSTGDIYCLFYELATKVMCPSGCGVYITSNKWLKSNYGESLRDYLISEASPSKILDLGPGVFETAAVDTNIILWRKLPYVGKTSVAVMNATDNLRETHFSSIALKPGELWNLDVAPLLGIKEKIEKISTSFANIGVDLDYGILTGANKTFILDEAKAKELIALDPKNQEIIKPLLRGQDLGRYSATFNGYYLLCSHNGVKKEGIPPVNIEVDYPTLVPYFESFGEKFRNRGEQGEAYYNLRNCAYLTRFAQPKIIYADIVQDQGKFYYDDEKYYTNDTAFLISGKYLLFLVGLLNSKAFTFFYKNFYCGGSLGKTGLRFKRDYLLRVPIPLGNENERTYVESLVSQIRERRRKDIDLGIQDLEEAIDIAIYRLYGLSYSDILTIDPEAPITREQYENYQVE